jgi:hypothetical protein
MTSDPKDEFCARFKARMIEMVGPSYTALDEDGRPGEEGLLTADYADMVAPTYWDDEAQREEGPEACAEADHSYWGD